MNYKVFKKWLVLRKRNQYESKSSKPKSTATATGNKKTKALICKVPAPTKIDHTARWNKDVDLHAYYHKKDADFLDDA